MYIFYKTFVTSEKETFQKWGPLRILGHWKFWFIHILYLPEQRLKMEARRDRHILIFGWSFIFFVSSPKGLKLPICMRVKLLLDKVSKINLLTVNTNYAN